MIWGGNIIQKFDTVEMQPTQNTRTLFNKCLVITAAGWWGKDLHGLLYFLYFLVAFSECLQPPKSNNLVFFVM